MQWDSFLEGSSYPVLLTSLPTRTGGGSSQLSSALEFSIEVHVKLHFFGFLF